MIFTTYEGRYDDAWIPAYDPSHQYHNPILYEWFLQKTRRAVDEDVTAAEDEDLKEYAPSIYPNPVYTDLRLLTEEDEIAEEIIISNTTGDVVLVAQDKPECIDISKLASGVYILRYKHTTGSTRSIRFVKI